MPEQDVIAPQRGPSPRAPRAAAMMLVLALAVSACDRNPRDGSDRPVDAVPAAEPTPPAKAPIVVALPSLGRADLIAAAGRAASAYASGETAQGVDPTIGRTFSAVLPFGCGGPLAPGSASSTADGLARAVWGPERKTIQLTMTPGDWAETALIADASAGWEAVEGVWIPRPWLAVDACPSVRADPLQGGAAAPSAQTVGLAAVFAEGGSRIGRRNGRAYAFTVRGQGEAAPVVPTGGWRMRLEGRVVGFPGGRAFRCRAAGPDQRPVCVAAVQLDRVAFEDAAGEQLGEWRPG